MAFRHEFVEFVPTELTEGTVYVSIRFATVSHLGPVRVQTKWSRR